MTTEDQGPRPDQDPTSVSQDHPTRDVLHHDAITTDPTEVAQLGPNQNPPGVTDQDDTTQDWPGPNPPNANDGDQPTEADEFADAIKRWPATPTDQDHDEDTTVTTPQDPSPMPYDGATPEDHHPEHPDLAHPYNPDDDDTNTDDDDEDDDEERVDIDRA
jgi:hypothetical protein